MAAEDIEAAVRARLQQVDAWPWKVTKADLAVRELGECKYDSPLDQDNLFVNDRTTVMLSSRFAETFLLMMSNKDVPAFERAGPRRKIFHNPESTTLAVVTCGGLCPGLNDVIKGIVNTAYYLYDVKNVWGIRYGYSGLDRKSTAWPPIQLTVHSVEKINTLGGSILGMSRGPIEAKEAVDALLNLNVNVLFCIGGDGTQKMAHNISEEISRRGLDIGIIGVPKTIDNDVNFVEKTFGFDTAVQEAAPALSRVSVEAESLEGGVGIVKLMGRDSGFITACATLAAGCVDFCLVPEVPFELDMLLSAVQESVESVGHSVIAVAEGAGQNVIDQWNEAHSTDCAKGNDGKQRDASGNVLHKDIGVFLKERIVEHAKKSGYRCQMKYIDPSYIIRSCPANPGDSVFCIRLAQYAVHAAMAGKTDMLVGTWHNRYTHVPLPVVVMARKKIDTRGDLWGAVVQTTDQRVRNLVRRKKRMEAKLAQDAALIAAQREGSQNAVTDADKASAEVGSLAQLKRKRTLVHIPTDVAPGSVQVNPSATPPPVRPGGAAE